MAAKAAFALGIDLGTNSARALIVNVADGREIAQDVANFPSGVHGVIGDPKDPNVARQHPSDYVTCVAKCVKGALKKAGAVRGFRPEQVIGIGVDTTGSTPLPVDKNCTPLAFAPQFKNDVNAYAWLWKDHTSYAEAEEITALAEIEQQTRLAACGGAYSSEWFWSKILHCRRVAPKVFKAAHSWLEQCDYIVAELIGCEDPAALKRSVCAAGHKAMYDAAQGLPDADFLKKLHPDLAALRARLYDTAYPGDVTAGGLCKAWAKKVGLPEGAPVAVGAIDAHLGAVGAGIKPGTLVKIMGTSVCDMLVMPKQQRTPEIPGLCGVVDGSIVPGLYGIEAGQPAVGDIFNWFVNQFDGRKDAHQQLTKEAANLAPGQSGLLALDWNNGNRSILVDVRLTGLLLGQTLHTTRAETYRALIEATAFGARVIMERMEEIGAAVKDVVTCGGIAEKNEMLMQIYADVTGRPMKISRSDQTCALGAAIYGAVAAGKQRGGYASVEAAQKAMCGLKPKTFTPRAAARKTYDELFALYRRVHDAFGGVTTSADLSGVMKDLIAIRDRVRGKK